MARWGPVAARLGRRVWGLHRLGMNEDDVQADLCEALLLGARKFANVGGDPPPDALAFCILRRRAWKLARRQRVPGRRIHDNSYPLRSREDDRPIEVADDDAPGAEDGVGDDDFEELCVGLAYALRRNLPPAAWAVLHLRFVDELEPSEIADMVGLSEYDPDAVHHTSHRIAHAKEAAREFLRTLGIGTLTQAVGLGLGDFDAGDLDG